MRDSYVLSLTFVAQQDCTMSPQPDITRHSPTFPDLVRQDCNMSRAELHVEQATTDCAPCNATCTCDVSWQVMIWRCHMIRVSHMITGKGSLHLKFMINFITACSLHPNLHMSAWLNMITQHVAIFKHKNSVTWKLGGLNMWRTCEKHIGWGWLSASVC